MRRSFKLAAFLLFNSCLSFGQTPYQIQDSLTENHPGGDSTPTNGFTHNGLLYFSADDGRHGREPWVTDGTPHGTHLLIDAMNGGNDSTPRFLGAAQGHVWFLADTLTMGTALWRTDGTPDGTTPFYSVEATPLLLTETDLYQWGDTGFEKMALSDGAVTTLVPHTYQSPQVTDLTPVNAKVYFIYSASLWVTDGTVEGTHQVRPGTVATMVKAGDWLYLHAEWDEISGRELWRYHTVTKTVALTANVQWYAPSSDIDHLTALNDGVFFQARDAAFGPGVYYADSIDQGADLLVPEVTFVENANDHPTYPLAHNGYVYFVGETAASGPEIWRTDGTVSGTNRISDIIEGPDNVIPTQLHALGNWITFEKDGRIWLSNGVTAPIALFSETTYLPLGVLGDVLYFQAALDSDAGRELYRYDPTARGVATSLVVDLNEPRSDGVYNVFDTPGPDAIFSTRQADSDAVTVQRTFGSAEQTTTVFQQDRLIDRMFAFGDGFLTQATAPIKRTFYKLHGVPQAGDVRSWEGGSHFRGATIHDNALYYSDNNYVYRIDDRGERTTLQRGTSMTRPAETDLASFDGWLYFSGRGESHFSHSLYRTDSGVDGIEFVGPRTSSSHTRPRSLTPTPHGLYYTFFGNLYLIAPGTSEPVLITGQAFDLGTHMLYMDGYLYFNAYHSDSGQEIWKTDGTEGNAVLVKDVNPGPDGSISWTTEENRFPDPLLTLFNGHVYFIANDGTHGLELHRSDGSTAGTTLVLDIYPGKMSSAPSDLKVMGNRLYFFAMDPVGGRELWETDGTPAGTQRVADLRPGSRGSNPDDLIAKANALYWAADDGVSGRELWSYRTTPDATINAPVSVCVGDTQQQAFVTNVPGATYAWVVTNGTIDSGQGTSAMLFTPDGNGDVQIDCTVTIQGVSALGSVTALLFNATPSIPGPITGDTTFCPHPEAVAYRIDPIAGATDYTWRFPDDVLVLSGGDTNEVTVLLGETSGQVGVRVTNQCGVGAERTLDITVNPAPSTAYAGPDQIMCDTTTVLNGIAPAAGTGVWRILEGIDGMIGDPTNPTSPFTGSPGETYVLEWRVSHGVCADSVDTVTLIVTEEFVSADAGPDQEICGNTTQLAGNQPEWGLGIWTVISGMGGHFSNIYSENATFTGAPNQTYVLRWTVRGKPCEVSTDEVTIVFSHPGSVSAGTDLCLPQGIPIALQATNTHRTGTWTILSGPDTDPAQLSDYNNPHALFTPTALGDYELSWTVSSPICGDDNATVVLSVTPANLQPETLTQLDKTTNDVSEGIVITDKVVTDAGIYFSAIHPRIGAGIWRTDGLSTKLIFNNAGPSTYTAPRDLTVVGDQLYFVSWPADQIDDFRLFRITIGEDIPREVFSQIGPIKFPQQLVAVGDVLYFTATYFSFHQLWRSDGSLTGTYPLRYAMPDFPNTEVTWMNHAGDHLIYRAGAVYTLNNTTGKVTQLVSLDTTPRPLSLSHGGLLYFNDRDDRLWRTDGTRAGTLLLTTAPTGLSQLTPMGDLLYFLANTSELGRGPFRTDGTRVGTFLVKDIKPGINTADVRLAASPHGLFVIYSNQIWLSDGTNAGTRLLVETNVNMDAQPTVVGDILYFRGTDQEPWRSNGTAGGTYRLKDLHPSGNSFPANFIGYQDRAVFTAVDQTGAGQLFQTQGTAGTTTQLMASEHRDNFTISASIVWRDELIFAQTQPYHRLFAAGETGQRLLDDRVRSQSFHPYGDKLLVLGTYQLGRLDSAGHYSQLSAFSWNSLHSPVTYNGLVYFLGNQGLLGRELYTTNGETVTLVKDINTGSNHGTLGNMITHNGYLYFIGETNDGMEHLFQSDGTAEGTIALISAEDLGGKRVQATETGFFITDPGLVFTDGTQAGTISLPYNVRGTPALLNNALIFATGPWDDLTLMISDGTEVGTVLLKKINPEGSDNVQSLKQVGDRVFFIATHPDTGKEPWVTDGTAEGTRLAADLNPGPLDSESEGFTLFEDKIYFTATVGHLGRELVVSDGLCTTVVGDTVPGRDGLAPIAMAAGPEGLFGITEKDGPAVFRLQPAPLQMTDANLQAFLLATFDTDNNHFLTFDEASVITTLDITGQDVVSLEGIEGLTALSVLLAADNQIGDLTPIMNHPNLGLGAGHVVDLRGNQLTADDCAGIDSLRTRLENGGGVLYVSPQGPVLGPPTYDQWPAYNILDFISGIYLPPDPLPCADTRQGVTR